MKNFDETISRKERFLSRKNDRIKKEKNQLIGFTQLLSPAKLEVKSIDWIYSTFVSG
jgi:hypothetical protein